MNAAVDRLEFAPPPTAGLLRALLLALIAHALLVAALTWGVNWRRQAELTPAEAELWASVPVAAAPKLQEPPPEPPAVEPPPPQPQPQHPCRHRNLWCRRPRWTLRWNRKSSAS